jgi:hypothetical protein
MAGKRRTLWIEANDPSTPQERLTKIAKNKRPELLLALLRNPNTPLPVLLNLIHRDPIGFINNPAVPLHFLESPGLLSTAPLRGLCVLATLSELPEWLISGFAAVPAPLKISILSEGLHPKLLFVFAQDSDVNLRGILTRHNRATAELLALLLPDALLSHRVNIASHPNASPETLAALATETSKEIRVAVARNRSTSAATLDELFQAPEIDIRLVVAENPSFAFSFHQERIRKQPSIVLRSLIPRVQSSALLSEMRGDASPDVRLAIAKNPNTDEETLALLALDRVSYVCQGVAENPNATTEMLRVIANGEHAHFCRLALARHPGTPVKIVESLSNDNNTFVQEAARKNLGLSPSK